MAVELIIAQEAQQDVDEAYSWYEDRRPGLGEEFLTCVDAYDKGSGLAFCWFVHRCEGRYEQFGLHCSLS